MKPTNIVLITADSLRADHLGCYGYRRNTSPNIDSFAQESVLFEDAISQGSWTVPSVTSILTSLYPSVHGLLAQPNPGRLNENKITLASHLSNAGYATAAFAGGGYVSEQLGLDQGFDFFSSTRYMLHERELGQGGRLKQEAREFLKWRRQSTLKRDKGFFAYLHCWDIHEPFIAHKKHLARFDQGYSGPLRKLNSTLKFHTSSLSRKHRCRTINSFYLAVINKNGIKLDDDDIRYIRALYDNEISFFDEQFGWFISQLQEHDLLDDSLVIFTADHGQELLERRGRLGHGGAAYETLVHVPLLVRLPGAQYGGMKVGEQAQGVDILPTVLDLLEIPQVSQSQGNSLVPLINGKRLSEASRPAFSMDVATKSIRWNGHKLITRSPEPYGDGATIAVHADATTRDGMLLVTGGMKVNLVDFERHSGAKLCFSVEARSLNGNGRLSLEIAHTNSTIDATVDQHWEKFEAPPILVPKKMPTNELQCKVVYHQGSSPLAMRACTLVNLDTGEVLFDYCFDRMQDQVDLYQPIELYHVAVDTAEKANVLAQKAEIAEVLYSKMRQQLKEDEERSQSYGDNPDAKIDGAFGKRLRQLGYVD